MMRLWLPAVLGALFSLENSMAEVQDFGLLLPPTDMYIHYADGYLRGPGATIDLKDLTFTALSEAYAGDDDGGDYDPFAGDDDLAAEYDDAEMGDDDLAFDEDTGDDLPRGLLRIGDKNNRRKLSELKRHKQRQRQLDGGVETDASQVDIVAFELPAKCANSRSGCDWTELGVGAKLPDDPDETLRWCCSEDAVELGMCEGRDDQLGRLIINEKLFEGEMRTISVPNEGPMTKKLKNGIMSFSKTGRYVVVFANCNEHGREIMVSGNAVWESKHGYLPGELFGFMYFYTLLMFFYAGLCTWYIMLMKQNEESRIPIEKWILITIALGLIELVFRTMDYWGWNATGVRASALTYIGIFFGVGKHGISRCLIVMVSLGWGVVRDSLGSTMRKIVCLGGLYILVAAARDLMIVLAVQDMQTLSYDEEVELFDVATVLTFIVAAIDVIFIMWILDALNGTMQYLDNMSQTRKLDRYMKLRTLLIFAILFAVIWAVFSLVNTYDEDGIVREEHEWIVDAASEINYLFVLTGVAWLWKPNPNAKEYAYVMELPASGGEDGETELELSGAVPSAMDDDEEPTDGGGFVNGTKKEIS